MFSLGQHLRDSSPFHKWGNWSSKESGNYFSLYASKQQRQSWMPPRTGFEGISLSVALCTIKKMCFRKILNVPSCWLKSHVSQRSGWDKCQAALWFYFSRFLAVPVPADFSITLSRLDIKSKSVSQTVFYKNKYLWFS